MIAHRRVCAQKECFISPRVVLLSLPSLMMMLVLPNCATRQTHDEHQSLVDPPFNPL